MGKLAHSGRHAIVCAQEMGGWENLEMVKKYAHLNADHLATNANVVTFWSPQVVEFVAENKKAACKAS